MKERFAMFRRFHRFFHEGSLFEGTFLNVPRVSYIFARVAGEWHSHVPAEVLLAALLILLKSEEKRLALLLPCHNQFVSVVHIFSVIHQTDISCGRSKLQIKKLRAIACKLQILL